MLKSDNITWVFLKSGLVHHLVTLLYSEDVNVIRSTLWILSNIAAADDSRMLDIFFQSNIFETVVYYLRLNQSSFGSDVMWILANMVKTGNRFLERPSFLAHKGMIQGFLSFDFKPRKSTGPKLKV